MNRRSFLRTLGLGAAGVAAAPYLPALAEVFPAPTPIWTKHIFARITFKNVPLVFDETCPAGRVYFLNVLQGEMRALTADIRARGLQ